MMFYIIFFVKLDTRCDEWNNECWWCCAHVYPWQKEGFHRTNPPKFDGSGNLDQDKAWLW